MIALKSLFLLLLGIGFSNAKHYYLPGVSPNNFAQGETVRITNDISYFFDLLCS